MNNRIKHIVKLIMTLAALAGLIVLCGAAIKTRRAQKTNGVQISISNPNFKFITEKDVQNIVQSLVDTVDNMSINELNIQQIEQEIEQNEYVEKCVAHINNQEGLELSIQQKRPAFRIIHENGVSYYVDNHGVKFSLSPIFTARVPIATGKIVYDVDSLGVQQGQAINDLLKFFEFTKQNDFAQALVSSVEVKPNGDFVFAPRTGHHLVNIGQPKDLDEKFNRLHIFYKQALNKLGWDHYSEVNLKFKNQIIAKKRKEKKI